MHADDAVLYYSSNSTNEIEKSINSDLELVSKWLASNDLIVNLKRGKTEFVLYGSPQKISRQPDCNITVNATPINQFQGIRISGCYTR